MFSSCFWPYTFKHGGFRYLVTFAGKFGLPWVIGKYPSGTDGDRGDELLRHLQKLILDATAVVPTDTEIAIETGGTGSRGATPQERLIALSNAELSKALTSQTLASEIQGQGSRAASETHRGRERAVNQSDRERVETEIGCCQGRASPRGVVCWRRFHRHEHGLAEPFAGALRQQARHRPSGCRAVSREASAIPS